MIACLLPLLLLQAPLKLSPLFSDDMVLQQGMDDPVFGTAAPGAYVQVEIGRQKIGATADSSGKWKVEIRPLPVGESYQINVTSGAEHLVVSNVAVGEVWIASGQSNMELPESAADDFDIAQSAANPSIRMFTVKKATSDKPLDTLDGSWEHASSLSVGHFSAVGLAFANELNRRLKVPIGIIHTSWGGTPAEAWTSLDALQRKPSLKPMVDSYLSDLSNYPEKRAAYEEAMHTWIEGQRGGENQGFQNGWAMSEFNDSAWQSVPAGTLVDTVLNREFDGSFWYRKTVTLPDDWYGKPLKLELGALDDYDSTYVNGVRVGTTDAKTENAWETPRVYTVPPGVVRKGANTIAIRVFNAQGPGGMRGPVDQMKIGPADGSASIPLSDQWKFKTEQELDPSAPRPHIPNGPGNPNSPGTLYNAMINPLLPYGIRGAIWYQGEANADRALQYAELFPTMIRDWRARWGEGIFPFYYVQLPNFMARQPEPGESAWAELREAQDKTLLLANTGMAVTIDIGEAGNIHPRNKKDVGTRLALIALGKTYHQPVVYASPRVDAVSFEGSTVRVGFQNGSLTTTNGQPPKSFALAGADKKYHWATARIDGSTVVVSCPEVAHPVGITYAWADNPEVNLVNHAGLPAAPFRQDPWHKES